MIGFVGAYTPEAGPSRSPTRTGWNPAVAKILPFGRELADTALAGVQGQQPVHQPSYGRQFRELAGALAFLPKGPPVDAVDTEDTDLVVHTVHNEYGPVGPEGDIPYAAELFGRSGVAQRLGSDGRDPGEPPFGWRAAVGDADRAVHGVDCCGEPEGGVIGQAAVRAAGREEKTSGDQATGSCQYAGYSGGRSPPPVASKRSAYHRTSPFPCQ